MSDPMELRMQGMVDSGEVTDEEARQMWLEYQDELFGECDEV